MGATLPSPPCNHGHMPTSLGFLDVCNETGRSAPAVLSCKARSALFLGRLYFLRVSRPVCDKYPEAMSCTPITQSSGTSVFSLTLSCAVTASNEALSVALTGMEILAVRPARIGRIPGLSSAIGKNGAVAGSKSTPSETSRTFEPAPQALSLTRTNQWECQSATSIAGSPS